MNRELLSSLEYIEKEKGIPKEMLLDALKQALISACRKTYPGREDFEIKMDPESCEIHLYENGKEIYDADFGRIAAQTAKQVIIQKIREAERANIFTEYSDREGDIVSGTVHRVDKKAIVVDLGKTEAVLPAREQCPQDHYRQGDLIRAYVLEVKKTSRGPDIILSRAHAGLVQRLFELEVPEIHDGIVEIRGIVREAGSRTKIAVHSTDDKIDSVGSCVGIRGQRVKNIVRELVGEKIDIIRYAEDTKTYIKNAMSPAVLTDIQLDTESRSAEVTVEDDQLSLAIGKKGQNVRLASKLLGWQLDVRSRSQKIPLANLDGVGLKTEELLKEHGIKSVRDLLRKTPEDLMKIPGIGEQTAEKILQAARNAFKKEPAAEAASQQTAEEPKATEEQQTTEEPKTTEETEEKSSE